MFGCDLLSTNIVSKTWPAAPVAETFLSLQLYEYCGILSCHQHIPGNVMLLCGLWPKKSIF
jgi:hypothetical protein